MRFFAALVCTVAMLITACDRTAAPPEPPEPTLERWTGAAADIRVRWSAEPGIDILTGPAVVIRAYLESVELANLMGDPAYVYPGFDRAVTPGGPHSVELLPDQYSAPEHQRVGTDYAHILRIDLDGRDLVTIVCQFSYAFASSLGGDEIMTHEWLNSGTSVKRITMTAPPDQSSSLPPQKGSLPAPIDDVFGEWQVTGARLGLRPDDWTSRNSDLDECITQAPHPVEHREYLMTGERSRADFPTLMPYPGWPATRN